MSVNHIIKEIKQHFGDRPIKIAELGVLMGESIPIFMENLNIQEYIGVDLFDNYEENNKDGSYELMKNHGSDIYNNLCNQYKENNIIFKKGYTDKVVSEFSDEYFDLIFIDAGHEYPQVYQDINLWYPKMKKNGIFSGDDYFYPPVKKTVNEFTVKHNIKLFNSEQKNPDLIMNDYWSWYVFT